MKNLKLRMIPFSLLSYFTWATSPIDQTDLFFGTEGGGHVFPGATRPFGMVKMGVDVIGSSLGDLYSGYAPDGHVIALSMMHESGTGGLPEYGVVAQLPYVGKIDFTTQMYNTRPDSDVASPGYYKSIFESGIVLEMAAADRSGMFQYTFPTDAQPQVIVNGSLHLVAPSRPWWTQYFLNGTLEMQGNSGYTGQSVITGGWGEQSPWTIYYCGEFDTKPTLISSFEGTSSYYGATSASSTVEDGSFGFVFQFPKNVTTIKSKVGVSFISKDQACSNIQNDFGDDYDFDTTVITSRNIWNDKVFDKVDVATENSTISSLIYTSLYGAHLLPSNRTGENPGWESTEPYYDDFFTLWDTFRCLNPLFNVLSPSTVGSEIVRSLIDTYRHDGFMPDGRSANQNGRTQGGSNADIVLADAFVKEVSNGVNWEDGYSLMVQDAEVQPPYVYDSFATDASTKEGRGALPDWLTYGWVTRNYTRSVTRTMEYLYDDFALSVAAQGLRKQDDYFKYLKRSANWQNIWNFNASTKSYNYTGFVQPKNADGEFNDDNYDPLSCGGCYWGNDEYEGKPVEYGWAVPHDVETLRSFIGSDDVFVQRLDDMFGLSGDSLADIGNEPSFLTPFMYNYVNRQYKTVETIRYLVNNHYSTGVSGLPGNSDAGAMQLWLFWSLIGMYPVAGTSTYLLSAPFVPSATINLENGRKVQITANSGDFQNLFYVQSVTVNNRNWNQNWISHDDLFSNGGWIHFEMGSTPTNWDTGRVPPSPGHYSLIET